jgi:hypothetical protein
VLGPVLDHPLVVRFAVAGLDLIDRPDMPRWQKLLSRALGTPASIALSVTVLMPTPYHALLRLGDAQWSNRDPQRVRYRGGRVPILANT